VAHYLEVFIGLGKHSRYFDWLCLTIEHISHLWLLIATVYYVVYELLQLRLRRTVLAQSRLGQLLGIGV
jgi:hypothetical protein